MVIRRLNQNNSMVLGAFAFFVLTPFAYTYYLQVFYSDLSTMLVLLLVLSILYRWPTYSRRQKIGAGLGLVVTILVGDLIKPNLIVLIPALVIVAVWLGVKKRLGKSQLMIPIILIVLGFGLSVPTTQAIQQTSNYHTNPKFELPATHWMLMAYNAGTQGTYSGHSKTYCDTHCYSNYGWATLCSYNRAWLSYVQYAIIDSFNGY